MDIDAGYQYDTLFFIILVQHEVGNGKIVQVLLLSLSKFFNSLDHKIPLRKLQPLNFITYRLLHYRL